MTYNPNTPVPVAVTQHRTAEPATGYPIPPITNLTPGIVTTIPFPVLTRIQTVPILLTHCVIANSSPYTLVVQQGANITQIPGFTADDVQVWETGQLAGISVLPQVTGAAVANGVDTSIYATWYSTDPPGVYPVAIGTAAMPVSQQTNIATFTAPVGTGSWTTPVVVPTWAQAIQFRLDKTSGNANGFYATVQDTATGITLLQGLTFAPGQTVFIPVGGRSVTFNFSPLNNGGSAGSLFGGVLNVSTLAGPITVPILGGVDSTPTTGIGPQNGLGAEITGFVGVGQTQIVPRCSTGFIIRLHTITFRMAAAPAAAGLQMHVRGGASGFNYVTWEAPNALPAYASFPMNGAMVGQNVGTSLDGNEALVLVNNSTVALACAITYDIIPVPWN